MTAASTWRLVRLWPSSNVTNVSFEQLRLREARAKLADRITKLADAWDDTPDPNRLPLLRGLRIMQALYETHPADAQGRCNARRCNPWWRPKRQCAVLGLLTLTSEADEKALWTLVILAAGKRVSVPKIHDWLDSRARGEASPSPMA